MARPIVLANGSMNVGINNYGLVHDVYFPYIGLENHSAGAGTRHRIGIWIDGTMSWLDDSDEPWEFQFDYHKGSLIGHIIAKNELRQITLEFDDFVDSSVTALIRNIHVINQSESPREVRVFMHQSFVIGDSRSNTDTAQYLPDSSAILHYRGRRAFVIGGSLHDESFDQHSIGLFGIEGREGTWRDAEDGELSGSNVEHGRVDSTIRFCLKLGARSSDRFHYWMAAGTSVREALRTHRHITDSDAHTLQHTTTASWHDWLEPAFTAARKIDPKYRDNFIKSIMLIKSHIDNRGAVIASTDSAMLNYSRDAYGYCWPRDGAYVLWPLIRLGYTEEALNFFNFCRRAINPHTGYLMHKYRADGALGSSWHPYVHSESDIVASPIQEDETASVVFVFAQYYALNPDTKLLDEFYEPMIKPMANFMADYIDDSTSLPKPTYDLWEEKFMTSTYSTAVTYGALLEAATLAEYAGDQDSAVKWRTVAEEIRHASVRFVDHERQSLCKGLVPQKDGKYTPDATIDISSFFGAFMYGLFSFSSEPFKHMAQTIETTFQKNGEVAVPRYEHDAYHSTGSNSLGNPWFVTSLWMAQYYLDSGQTEKATNILDWVNTSALKSGVLSEQVDPHSGAFLSVAPLAWSHAEFASTLLDSITES